MASTPSVIGAVTSLWRYPVKSMQGEELNAADVTPRGLLGDRAFALVDEETGKVASAKNPRRWPTLFDFRAAYIEPPGEDRPLPPVRITLADGETRAFLEDGDTVTFRGWCERPGTARIGFGELTGTVLPASSVDERAVETADFV